MFIWPVTLCVQLKVFLNSRLYADTFIWTFIIDPRWINQALEHGQTSELVTKSVRRGFSVKLERQICVNCVG